MCCFYCFLYSFTYWYCISNIIFWAWPCRVAKPVICVKQVKCLLWECEWFEAWLIKLNKTDSGVNQHISKIQTFVCFFLFNKLIYGSDQTKSLLVQTSLYSNYLLGSLVYFGICTSCFTTQIMCFKLCGSKQPLVVCFCLGTG